ncbi:FeoB-associated Cys-rich membrane protein [Clostridium oryzae]|nr:FeoB-associated Cys-rich membrane protein [Clostridium oryzae]
MNILDYIILLIVFLLAAVAIYFNLNKKDSCCNCSQRSCCSKKQV